MRNSRYALPDELSEATARNIRAADCLKDAMALQQFASAISRRMTFLFNDVGDDVVELRRQMDGE